MCDVSSSSVSLACRFPPFVGMDFSFWKTFSAHNTKESNSEVGRWDIGMPLVENEMTSGSIKEEEEDAFVKREESVASALENGKYADLSRSWMVEGSERESKCDNAF